MSVKKMIGVCGVLCETCTVYIGSREDPERLERHAKRYGHSAEEMRCSGCHSEKRSPLCSDCEFIPCAHEKGVEFCGECPEFPCGKLVSFKEQAPHRIEIFDHQSNMKAVGYDTWFREIQQRYSCKNCGAINSAYDLACRKCGNSPSCDYTADHGEAVRRFLKER